VNDSRDLLEVVRRLLASQPLAVLATQGGGQPYASLVAFVPSGDLATLAFATSRATRKYSNLNEEPRVALLMDNRSNRETDFREATAVTATGVAEEVLGADRAAVRTLYVGRHPHLAAFVEAPSSVLFRVRVETYVVVQEFQRVVTLRP